MKYDHRIRWVYVADVIGEFEINFRVEPTHCPSLKVEIVGMRRNQIVERTWTYNKKYRRGDAQPEFHSTRPPGRLWKFEKDGPWRRMEPDGLLPLFGLEHLNSGRPVMVHEGAKAAAYCQWLTSDDRDAKRALKDHPWGNDLKDYVHLGWPGGANRPNGVDWGPIRRSSPTLSVILVCDRDWVGEQAAAAISSASRRAS
jgi:hypothetical protein